MVLFYGVLDVLIVDVVVEDGLVLFDNIEYGIFSDYVGVVLGVYILDVMLVEDNIIVVCKYDVDISGLIGGVVIVFVSGFLSEGELEFGVWVVLIDGIIFLLVEIVVINEFIGILDVYIMFLNFVVSSMIVEFSLLEFIEINF